MKGPLCLITGSRQFTKTGENWCRAILGNLMVEFPRNTVILHGGAVGPDTWADELAEFIGMPRVRYFPTGRIEAFGIELNRDTWKPIDFVNRQSYLDRNSAMIHAAILYNRYHGAPVVCVGFKHPNSKTNGTEYTVKRAKRAQIWTEVFTLP